MKRLIVCLTFASICVSTTGCVLTKILTVPMRVVAAGVSVVPVVGNTGHDVIDEAAEAVDKLPF